MRPQKANFVMSHGLGRSAVGRGSELINGFAQKAAQGAKERAYILGAPGTELFTLLDATEKVAALIPAFDKLIAVTDKSTYLVDSDGTSTRLGDGLYGQVDIAYNGTVCVAVNGYVGIEISETAVTQITSANFYGADRVWFIDGYFVFNRKDTGQYFISGLYNTEFDGLDFATAESSPDNIVSIVAIRREVWLLGRDNVEVHYNSGASFPFARMQGVSINYGCASPMCATAAGNSVLWLSDQGIVFQSSGYSEIKISTHEIDEEIAALSDDWSTAYATTYIEDGHEFYLLTIGLHTFCYDLATQMWHKRSNFTYGRHIANCMAHVFNKNIVGDDEGRLLTMSRDLYQDVDDPLIMVMGSITYSDNNEFRTVDSFEVDGDVGAGGESTLEYSRDDGKTWSDRKEASIGAVGHYSARLKWRRLGRARSKRFRLRVYGNHSRRFSTTALLEVSA